MTTQQMLNAFPVMQKIMTLNLPIKTAYKVYTLAKQINDKKEFFINEEKKLIEIFQAEVLENGNIRFNSYESQEAFSKKHAELFSYEIDDIEMLELSFSELKDATFTPNDIHMLEGVVNFID